MDEAGYGPNLGPLVIAATKWKVVEDPSSTNLTELLEEIVDSSSRRGGTKLHIADSKAVNVGKDGFLSLELSALSLLKSAGKRPRSVHELWRQLTDQSGPNSEVPWFEADMVLPAEANDSLLASLSDRFVECVGKNGIECLNVAAQIVPARQFNTLLATHHSKGVLLSSLSMELLARLWKPSTDTRTLVIADKHGGRNRYDELLAKISGDAMIFRIAEGREISRYRVESTEIRFQTRAEQHFQVAAASIVAKYVRELAMRQFNQFWQEHCPDVAPTKGYPTDAVRFRKQVQDAQCRLGIPDHDFWRVK